MQAYPTDRYKYKPSPAFQDWINSMEKGNRLPRGRFLDLK